MNLKHIISWQCFCGSNILTLSWRVSVHCPITLYPGVLLTLIWYWKRSYRPGASPFRLNVTDVPALPTKERIIFRNVPSTLSDENTLHQPYIKKEKKAPTCLADIKKKVALRREKKFVWLWQKYKQHVPLRPRAETDKSWHSIPTDCLKSFTCRAWHSRSQIYQNTINSVAFSTSDETSTPLFGGYQPLAGAVDTFSSHLLHWVVQGSFQ